ncbi:Choline kinase [Ekhidna lutea]|uniref:Choline kinase n=1 Tax=Ekhidna lutea TaxID=447679 RepID=A0A239FTK5_EKHLU|nr:NTP transferase domain-containing protein [Ekhidna lutea]SNS60211.1 Choline kinase [Ekhidna lutea]
MNLVILAAGKNTRLDTGIPKSLVTLNGETLMSRHIRVFKKHGVKKFCIISGYGSEKLQEALPKLKKTHDADITILHNDRFDLENGFSVFRAKEWVEENEMGDFFLTMGDHIFDPEFVGEFVKKSDALENVLQLAVDMPGESNSHIDIDDVTKVQVDENGFIDSIGKTIEKYNRYDTGLFRLKSEVFDVFQKSFDQKEYTISESVSKLMAGRQAKSVLVEGYTWNDVDNPDDLQSTIKLMDQDRL